MKQISNEQTAIVVANGPSLNDVPLEFLTAYRSFGTNAIYLREDFYPTCYVAFDKGFIKREQEDVQKFVDLVPYAFVRQDEGIVGDNVRYIYRIDTEKPSGPNHLAVMVGGTVTYIALQLALMANMRRILIVGLDFDYFDPNKPMPHFDERYPAASNRSANAKYWNTHKSTVELHFEHFRKRFGEIGGEVLNLTPNTQCRAFKTGDIEDYA